MSKKEENVIPNVWIYKSRSETSVVIKPTTSDGVYDNNGKMVQVIKIKPIYLSFPGCYCTVNEAFAKLHNLDIETLIKMIESTPEYERVYWKIHSPKERAIKEELLKVEESRKNKVTKVSQGVRNRKS